MTDVFVFRISSIQFEADRSASTGVLEHASVAGGVCFRDFRDAVTITVRTGNVETSSGQLGVNVGTIFTAIEFVDILFSFDQNFRLGIESSLSGVEGGLGCVFSSLGDCSGIDLSFKGGFPSIFGSDGIRFGFFSGFKSSFFCVAIEAFSSI